MIQTPVSFDQLAEHHRPELLAYLTRLLGDPHDAEDACQDTLLRAYRAFNRLKPGSNSRAWLYKIATNTALNALKRRTRAASRTSEANINMLPIDSTDTFERRERLRAIAQAVEALPSKQRAALMLRRFQEMGYAEIAATLDCSEAAARANVYQAVKRLREALADSVV